MSLGLTYSSERSAAKPIVACEWSRTMPGPSPLDRPTFPDQFLEECRSLVRRRTVPHDRRQRARLVFLLHESPGLSNVAAGALVELHAHSVQRWRRRWACGNFSLADRAGRGRKPAFSPSRSGNRQGDRL
jgi:Homeodomain-like domain